MTCFLEAYSNDQHSQRCILAIVTLFAQASLQTITLGTYLPGKFHKPRVHDLLQVGGRTELLPGKCRMSSDCAQPDGHVELASFRDVCRLQQL